MAQMFDDLGESVVALIVSAAVAVVAAASSFFAVAFEGAKLFRDEWSYGIGLAFGPAAMLLAGVATFLLLYRKIRSL